ncbi:hypothetical protein [Planktothrix sp.]|uniref:hypothetical protein n=1 Tax=Planktothrix sp. TaxID=3088171 RepID=UPI0038D48DF3
MSLRHFLVASSLILSPVAVIGVQSTAFAESANDSINISGNVPASVTITSTAADAATSLPLSTAGTQTVKIADITVTTNFGGAILTATSTNNGVLLNSNNPNDNLQYQLDIVGDGGQAGNFSNIGSFSRTVQGELDLYIQVNNPAVPKKGSYNDTITLTVSDQ